MSQYLGRDTIEKADSRQYADVEVPEWGGKVRIRSLTGKERDQFEASTVEQRGNNRRLNLHNLRARLAVLVCVDEHGNRLFSDDDVRWLGNKNAKALDRIFIKGRELSGLDDEDIEELTEGFDDAQSDSSTSD